jgi:hypothetical protein
MKHEMETDVEVSGSGRKLVLRAIDMHLEKSSDRISWDDIRTRILQNTKQDCKQQNLSVY